MLPDSVLPVSVLPVSVLPTPCSPLHPPHSVLPAPRGPSLHVVRGDRLSFVLIIGFIVLIDLDEPDFGFVGLPWLKVTDLCFPVPVFILPLSCLRCSEFAVVFKAEAAVSHLRLGAFSTVGVRRAALSRGRFACFCRYP